MDLWEITYTAPDRFVFGRNYHQYRIEVFDPSGNPIYDREVNFDGDLDVVDDILRVRLKDVTSKPSYWTFPFDELVSDWANAEEELARAEA